MKSEKKHRLESKQTSRQCDNKGERAERANEKRRSSRSVCTWQRTSKKKEGVENEETTNENVKT